VGGFSPPDPRVLMLPLAQNRWPKPYRKGFMSKREPIEIKVESSGIRCLTPPLPPKR
jgi:hypothetical protein